MNTNDTEASPRRTIASFPRYQEAQALVDQLANDGFPVQHLTIVATDLRLVEHVTGRLNAARAALSGAFSAALWGALFGWLFAIAFTHDGVSSVAIFLYWVLLAVVFGAIFGLVAYLFMQGRRDFTSVSHTEGGRYDVLADDAVADEALSRMPSSPRPAAPASWAPPSR